MSSDEKVAWAAELKERGNRAFKAGEVQRAVKKWERAAEMLRWGRERLPDSQKLCT